MLSQRIRYFEKRQKINTVVFDEFDIYKGKSGSEDTVDDLAFTNRASVE